MTFIPGYTIESELGRGGMGRVYLAVQEFTQRHVAIKVMDPRFASDPDFGDRFLKEARSAVLNHRNIVSVYDAGEHNGTYYIVLEYITGGDLTGKIRQGLTIDHSIDIITQVSSALGFAHQNNYIHRDVKPDNILFREDGTAVLTDFGIAKATTSKTSMTAVGMVIGSPHYMSPEQARGEPLDHRSDLYSLGVVLYEMLTGNKPYDAEDTFGVGLKHINDPIPLLSGKSAYLQPVINKLMAKKPFERYASTEQFVNDLQAVHAGDRKPDTGPGSTVIRPAIPRTETHPSRSNYLFPAIAFAGILGLAVTAYYFRADWLPATETELAGHDNQSEQKKKITALLQQAESMLHKGALVLPKDANANAIYRQVLTLEPDNRTAKEGLQAIVNKFIERAQEKQAAEEFIAAIKFVEQGQMVIEDHPKLRAMKKTLQEAHQQQLARIEKHRQIELKQQTEAEQKRQSELKRQAEAERQRLEELKRQAEAEKQRQAELKRQAEAERQRLEELKRQADAEKLRQAELKRQAEAEKNRQAELKRQAEEEIKKKNKSEQEKELAKQKKLIEKLRQRNLALINKSKLKPGKHNKILVVGYMKVTAQSQYKTTEEESHNIAYHLTQMVEDYIPTSVTAVQESEAEIGYNIVIQDSAGKVSHLLCDLKKVDYVLAGVVDEADGDSYGQRTSYASLFDCKTEHFQREEFETGLDNRVDPLVANLKKIVVGYIKSSQKI